VQASPPTMQGRATDKCDDRDRYEMTPKAGDAEGEELTNDD